ncbi:nitrate- and nitrite sensing domain-containing protein [Streptacidiphilus monticola]
MDTPQDIVDVVQQGYSNLIFPLMGTANELAFSDNTVNSRGREIYALALAKASVSTERYLVLVGLVSKGFPNDLVVAVKTANKLTSTALGQFQLSNIPADWALFKKTVQGNPDLQQQETNLFAVQANHEKLSKTGITPTSWYAHASQIVDQERTTEQALIKQVLDDTAQAKSDARQNAIVTSAEALAAVLLAGLLTFFISRSMVRSMRRLRDTAQAVASERLPDMVRRLSRTDPERVDTSVAPIPINSTDEIGEVARAFDDVHREAVRLASEQALLRGNVNAIFTNLSRRSHGLIERQLALITDLENNEADPDQLENLFKLDHLATRMRRNGENLLVLAGEDAGRSWGEPIPLVDVLRAAASEVEQYERIELSGIPETDVVGPAVTDLVHLLAELLENATTFSSPQTRVRVNATRLPDQRVLVEIHDKGIGLTASDFTEINAKLAEPPTVDASVSRQMGLFVVGRLAERHGIRVQLRPSGESAGTTSLVMLPEHLTQLPRVGEPEEQFTVSRIYPEAEAAAAAFDPNGGPLRTADELGFDDSRYGRQAVAASAEQAPTLDSVQRSLRLGQRREQAALAGPDGVAPAAAAPAGPGDATGSADPLAVRDYGRDFDEYRPGSTQTYPSSLDPAYEAGRYTAQDFEAAAGTGAGTGFPQDAFGGGFAAPAANGMPQQPAAYGDGGFGDHGGFGNAGAFPMPGTEAPAGGFGHPGDTGAFPAAGPNGLPQRRPGGFGGPAAPQGRATRPRSPLWAPTACRSAVRAASATPPRRRARETPPPSPPPAPTACRSVNWAAPRPRSVAAVS